MVIAWHALNDDAVSELCRIKGMYPQHVKQCKLDFSNDQLAANIAKMQADNNELKIEIRNLNNLNSG